MNTDAATNTNSGRLGKRRPLTPWELPSLLSPMHRYRRRQNLRKVERPHFPAVLSFVYRNRFAVASQIQRRFADVLTSDRTTRRHLTELEALRYLGVAPTRSVGPLFPKVYYVTGRGVKRMREELAGRGLAKLNIPVDRRARNSKEGYSAEQVIHEILLTEFLLAVWQTVKQRSDLRLLTVQRRSLRRHPAFRLGTDQKAASLVPDAMFLFSQQTKGMVCCFVELDTGTMNRKQITAKYWRYEAWSRSEIGQQLLLDLYRRHGVADLRPNFRVVVVTQSRSGEHDNDRLTELLLAAKDLPGRSRDRLWLAAVDAIREHQHEPLPLSAPVWLRARDLRFGQGDGSDIGRSALGGGEQAAGHHRELTEALQTLPRHPLFPLPVVLQEMTHSAVNSADIIGGQ